VATPAAFFLIIIAGFMTWGTIRYHYTWQFMANLEHSGLCNRILTGEDLSGSKFRLEIEFPKSWLSHCVFYSCIQRHSGYTYK
jgi:hypothetical protein